MKNAHESESAFRDAGRLIEFIALIGGSTAAAMLLGALLGWWLSGLIVGGAP